MSFWHALQRAADAWPDAAFLVGDLGRGQSRSDLLALAARLAGGLQRCGVRRGDRVAILSDASDRVVALQWALAGLGAIQVPLNPALRGPLLADVLEQTTPTVIATTHVLAGKLREEGLDLQAKHRLLLLDEAGPAAPPVDGCSWAEAADASPLAPVDAADHEPLVIIYTSGTTGRSKGVVLSHRWAEDYSRRANAALGIEPGDRHYAFLPLFHIAGQYAHVSAAAIAGASVALSRPFRAADFWIEVDRHRCTAAVLMSSMQSVLRNREAGQGRSLGKLHLIPVPPDFRDVEREFGCRVTTNYGSTEASIPLMNPAPGDHRSCGRLVEGCEARVVDEWDEPVPDGQVGELVLRPGRPWTVMSEYWGRPDATAAAWRNGWLHTGDLFIRRADGHFEFVDRAKDAIRRRGENISSYEVEILAGMHPSVLEVAAVAADTGAQDQEVALFYSCKPGLAVSPGELTAHMERVAPRFMVPRYLCAMANLPRTETGKIQKAALRGVSLQELWDRRSGAAADGHGPGRPVPLAKERRR